MQAKGRPSPWPGLGIGRKKPLINIHYWWETVIDPLLLRLARDEFVATRRAVGDSEGYRYQKNAVSLTRLLTSKRSDGRSPGNRIAGPACVQDCEEIGKRRHGACPSGFDPQHVAEVHRRSHGPQASVGRGNLARRSPGWNRDVLGKWPRAPFAAKEADPKAVVLPVQLPDRIGTKMARRDEFVVACLFTQYWDIGSQRFGSSRPSRRSVCASNRGCRLRDRKGPEHPTGQGLLASRFDGLWALQDSNLRPLPCKGSALAN